MKPKKINVFRDAPLEPPIPDFSIMTGAQMWAAGWPRITREGVYDPYKYVRPHPNALAHRRLDKERSLRGDRHEWRRHPITRALFRLHQCLDENFDEFFRAIEYGLNPYDIDWTEYFGAERTANALREAQAEAEWAREDEERRRNPPPPTLACRIVACSSSPETSGRVMHLALHARYGKRWRPTPRERGLPIFEMYQK